MKSFEDRIKKFCENPNKNTITQLTKKDLDLFYKYSKKVVKNKTGNVKLAQIILKYSDGYRYQCIPEMSICEETKKHRNEPFENFEYLVKEKCYESCVLNDSKKYRVRTILSSMNFTELNKQKIFPKPMFTKVLKKGGVFPKMAKKVGYSWFGIFMEKYIGTILESKTLPTEQTLGDLYIFISMQIPPDKYLTEIELISDFSYFLDIGKWLLESFPNTGKILFEPEWDWGRIQGHPDIVMEEDEEIVIYDVKTTGLFGQMRLETILQLLSYYCLNKVLKIGAKKIGLILPAQKTIIKVDLSGWKWKPFWKALNIAVKDQVDYTVKSEFNTFIEPYYGTHIEKVNGKVWKGLEKKAKEYGRRPYQIFISGPRGGQITETTKDEKKTLEIVTKHKLQYFIHTPYIINLCREEGKEKDTKDTEAKFKTYTPSEELRRQVDYGVRTGCSGVVIHMGKQVNLKENDAISNMLINIENAAPSATKTCPILLETGSGIEMLSDLKKFIDFYECLSDTTKEVTGICLDTCHVFAAGFMPMDAIRILEEAKIPIKLIHYNDSKCSFGSKKDRHQTIGKGMIPIRELINVGYWAIKKSVPLVGE